MRLKDRLATILSNEELAEVISSFDIVGDIAIIKAPGRLESKKRQIAKAVREQHNHIKTVLRKTEKTKGEYRVAEYEVLLGKDTETVHKEFGCRYAVDPTKVYFSPRLGSERMRVLDQVKDGEVIHALFAGIGPYPILIAKRRIVKIHAIEKNPLAFSYLKKNVETNHVEGSVSLYKGDVRSILPEINVRADRTLMPLPAESSKFLDLAFRFTKYGGVVHYYCFGLEEEVNVIKKELKESAQKYNKSLKIMNVVRCGTFAPRVNRYCVDFKVLHV